MGGVQGGSTLPEERILMKLCVNNKILNHFQTIFTNMMHPVFLYFLFYNALYSYRQILAYS